MGSRISSNRYRLSRADRQAEQKELALRMERWAANTLRSLANILLAGLVLISSLFLLLLSLCSWQGGFSGDKHPDQALVYLIAAVTVMAVGSLLSGWLARSIIRSAAAEAAPTPAATVAPGVSAPVPASPAARSIRRHFSPLGRKAINRLVLALIAQIVLSAATWFYNQLHLWTAPRAFAPHNWTLILLAPFILYHLPYAILIYYLLKRPDSRAFAYALALPIILVVQALFSISVLSFTYTHQPLGFLLLFLPGLLHIVILVLAYKAIQQTGIHPIPSSLMTAALATVIYLFVIHAVTPILYQLAWRY